jgi:hypothetical protein
MEDQSMNKPLNKVSLLSAQLAVALAFAISPVAYGQTTAPSTAPPAKVTPKAAPAKGAATDAKSAPAQLDKAADKAADKAVDKSASNPAKLKRQQDIALLSRALDLSMLAERATKAFAQLRVGVSTTRANVQLKEAIRDYDTHLAAVIKAAPTPEIKDNYELLSQLWSEYRTIAQSNPSPANLAKMAEQNEELVWISKKGATLIEAHVKQLRTQLITVAGDARVAIQRVAKLQLFKAAGVKSKVIEDDIKAAEADYRKLMATLVSAPENKDDVAREIQLVENQWLFLKDALKKAGKGTAKTEDLVVIASTADNILEGMNRVLAKLEEIGA